MNAETSKPTAASSPAETIGDRIRKLRESRGLNQSELGRHVGMTSQAINLIESGGTKSPTPQNLLAIADYFSVTMRELITGEKPGPEESKELLFKLAEELPEAIFPVQMSLDLTLYRIEQAHGMMAKEDAAKYLAWIDRIKEDMRKKRDQE